MWMGYKCVRPSLEINRQNLGYLSNMLSQTLHEKNQYDDGLVALSDGHSFGYNHKLGEKKKKKNRKEKKRKKILAEIVL
jgi:hypothetical protein